MLSTVLACVSVVFAPVLSDLGPRDKVTLKVIDNQGPYRLQPVTEFYIPDKKCSGYLDETLMTCEYLSGPEPATWLNVTVADFAAFPAVVVSGGARAASLYRAAPCAGDALVAVTRYCAREPDTLDVRGGGARDGFALPEAHEPDPIIRLATEHQ